MPGILPMPADCPAPETHHTVSLEHPVLRLGLAGFSRASQALVAALLSEQPKGWPHWRVVPFADADAWWVDGSQIRVLRDGTLKVAAAERSDRALQINLSEVDRPIAFSTPLVQPDFEPAYTFDLEDETSVRHVLQQFEGWLRPLRAQFALGAEIIHREADLKPAIYHLSLKGALLAVVDLHEWQVGLSPTARPVDLDQASWDKRPAGANDIPSGFVRMRLAQVMWTYAQRTRQDVLPARYRGGLIYLRHAPMVPAQWLSERQQWLLAELAQAPESFDSLRERSGTKNSQLSRDLAILYFSGALTSEAANAAAAKPAKAAKRAAKVLKSAEVEPSPIGADSRLAAPSPNYILGVRA